MNSDDWVLPLRAPEGSIQVKVQEPVALSSGCGQKGNYNPRLLLEVERQQDESVNSVLLGHVAELFHQLRFQDQALYRTVGLRLRQELSSRGRAHVQPAGGKVVCSPMHDLPRDDFVAGMKYLQACAKLSINGDVLPLEIAGYIVSSLGFCPAACEVAEKHVREEGEPRRKQPPFPVEKTEVISRGGLGLLGHGCQSTAISTNRVPDLVTLSSLLQFYAKYDAEERGGEFIWLLRQVRSVLSRRIVERRSAFTFALIDKQMNTRIAHSTSELQQDDRGIAAVEVDDAVRDLTRKEHRPLPCALPSIVLGQLFLPLCARPEVWKAEKLDTMAAVVEAMKISNVENAEGSQQRSVKDRDEKLERRFDHPDTKTSGAARRTMEAHRSLSDCRRDARYEKLRSQLLQFEAALRLDGWPVEIRSDFVTGAGLLVPGMRFPRADARLSPLLSQNRAAKRGANLARLRKVAYESLLQTYGERREGGLQSTRTASSFTPNDRERPASSEERKSNRSSLFHYQVVMTLRDLGETWESEVPVGPYTADVWLPERNLIIETEGPMHFRNYNCSAKTARNGYEDNKVKDNNLGSTEADTSEAEKFEICEEVTYEHRAILRDRLLQKMGHRVLHIPFFHWPEARRDRARYLQRMIARFGEHSASSRTSRTLTNTRPKKLEHHNHSSKRPLLHDSAADQSARDEGAKIYMPSVEGQDMETLRILTKKEVAEIVGPQDEDFAISADGDVISVQNEDPFAGLSDEELQRMLA
ncbi:unnamed protein product [Amoebophrya sp. A25]|nr:unnamed protein product [Amoebophrya sp. A25]|eukprot:GSA25T00005751001.1